MTLFSGESFNEPARWVEIEMDGTVLTPRRQLGSVPYAFNAERLNGRTYDEILAAADGAHYANVVVVAKTGGDYTSVQAAIDGISDASADSPYLIWAAPGVYAETVTMKPYIHIQGAGQEATSIVSSVTGPPDGIQATLLTASHTSLRDLTVVNTGEGPSNRALWSLPGTDGVDVGNVTAWVHGNGVLNYAVGVIDAGTRMTFRNVTALAEGGTGHNVGMLISDGGLATAYSSSFTGRGGHSDTIGILNLWATLEAEDVTAVAEGCTHNNFGLYNFGTKPAATATLRGGRYVARGGNSAAAVKGADPRGCQPAEGSRSGLWLPQAGRPL